MVCFLRGVEHQIEYSMIENPNPYFPEMKSTVDCNSCCGVMALGKSKQKLSKGFTMRKNFRINTYYCVVGTVLSVLCTGIRDRVGYNLIVAS